MCRDGQALHVECTRSLGLERHLFYTFTSLIFQDVQRQPQLTRLVQGKSKHKTTMCSTLLTQRYPMIDDALAGNTSVLRPYPLWQRRTRIRTRIAMPEHGWQGNKTTSLNHTCESLRCRENGTCDFRTHERLTASTENRLPSWLTTSPSRCWPISNN